MRIAVASDDRETVSRHFGGAAYFLIFEVKDGVPELAGVHENSSAGHHLHGHGHGNGNVHGHGDHHREILAALDGCSAVISGGMGRRMVADLLLAGIRPVFSAEAGAREAVVKYLDGKLEGTFPGCGCGCSGPF